MLIIEPACQWLEITTTGEITLTRRILVVDDDPDIRQVLQDRLESYGYTVKTAVDGREALQELGRAAYDGMLLDIRMPDLDGLEVLEQVRKSHPLMPVVMITASASEKRATQAIRKGAQAYLFKPFDMEQIKRVVERWFGPVV